MALAEVQKALARLFTDAALREVFLSDPQHGAARLGLDAIDARLLGAIAPKELRSFVASLSAKRALDARRRTPLVAAALANRFETHFEAASSRSDADVVEQADALARRLSALARDGQIEPCWIGDLARYEAACVAASNKRFFVRAHWFRYPIGVIVTALLAGAAMADIPSRRSLGVWLRYPGGRLWRRLWSVD
jgi:hypothetical protein